MNNIYVDELPKRCDSCVGYGGASGRCKLLHKPAFIIPPKDCPLKPLSDRLAEERNKVCEQIYKLLTNDIMWSTMKDWWLNSGTCRELRLVLDAVENGMENKEIVKQFSNKKEYYALLEQLKKMKIYRGEK